MLCSRKGCGFVAPFYVTRFDVILPMCILHTKDMLAFDGSKLEQGPFKLGKDVHLMPGQSSRWKALLYDDAETLPPIG